MKKILNIIGLSTALLLSSCDMDKIPQGYADREGTFDTVESVEYLEKGGYARLRTIYNLHAIIVPDIQADYVNAVQGFSNTYGPIFKWDFRQNEAEIDDVWRYSYVTINHCNFVLNGIETKMNFNDRPKSEQDRLELVRGRMYLMRAMSYSMLAERFCADYDEATAKNEYSGVPLVLDEDITAKPGRATLYDVYDQILKDIADAKLRLAGETGSADAIYLNADCVSAFEAHIHLQMDNYKAAYETANILIDNTKYALASNQEEFSDIWTYDRGKEIIYKFASSKTELPPAFGSAFYYDQRAGAGESKGEFSWACDYVPAQSLLDSYDASDYRQVWFSKEGNPNKQNYCWAGQNIIAPGYTVIKKFPGNPELRTSNLWNLVNTHKVFRLAEMYLIAAEAAIMDPSVVTSGKDALTLINTLRTHRGLTELASVSMTELKAERYKELMLEGFRITDLKRWGDNIKRGESQKASIYSVDPITGQLNLMKENDYFTISQGRDLNMPIDDYRVVWPIPSDEIYANQTLAGQQNPGWEQ